MRLLRADTQVKVVIGPAVAVGDGFTPVTTLALTTADEAELMKHDAAAVTDISGNTWAAITSMDGYYNLTLSTTDTNTEGMLTLGINDDSLSLPLYAEFMVMNANAYDAFYAAAATDYLQVDMLQVGGDAQSATDLKDFADAGYDPATNKVQGVVTVDSTTAIAAGGIAANSFVASAINAAAVAADAVAEIQSGLMTTAGYTAPDNAGIAANTLAIAAVQADVDIANAALIALDANLDNFQNVTVIQNTTGVIKFPMFLTGTETPATGLTITAYRSLDSATSWSAVTGTIAEIANGWYNFAYSAADSNGREIAWRFTEATCKDTVIEFYTSIA